MRRNALLLATMLVAGCTAGSPTPAPQASASVTIPPASPHPSAVSTTAPSRPATLPRTVDVPLDGTCEETDASCFGIIQAGKRYTTKVFEPATSFIVQGTEWVNPFDGGGDFSLFSTRDVGDAIYFFRGARSVDKSVGATALDIATWLERNDNLNVTPVAPVKIGGLSGVTLDVRVSPTGTNTDPGCPVQICVLTLRGDDPQPNDPYQWHWNWASAGTEAQRMYLLDGKDTVVAIILDSIDGLTFHALTQEFDAMKASITFN